MRFDVDKKPTGTRFDFDDGGWVELRVLSPDDWIAIRKATVKKKPFAQKGDDGVERVYVADIVDDDLQRVMIHDLCIVNWGDLFDKNEKPLPCTKAMKSHLMLMPDGTFRDFVNEKLKLLAEKEPARQEAVEKN